MTTKAEKLQHIANWQKSGLSRPVYCRKYNLKYGTFMSWFPKKVTAPSSTGKFISLQSTKPSTLSIVKIVLPNGIEIQYRGKLDRELLEHLANV